MLAGAAFLAAAYLALAVSTPASVGLWGDDAVYVATAHSLAQGDGYRHIEKASQPLQTKYPILYPATLALAIAFGSEFPANVPWMLTINALAAAGLIVVAFTYWKTVLGSGGRLAWWLAALVAASPVVLSFVRYTMSELLYALLATGSLLCLDYRWDRREPTRASLILAGAGALLAGLAVLTRTIGLSLAAAVLLTLVLRRRFMAAGAAAGVLALCILPWVWWQSASFTANASLPASFLNASDLDYSLWLTDDPMQSFRVIRQNAVQAVFAIAYSQLALPAAFVGRALASPSWQRVALHGICYLAAGLVLLGFGSSMRERVLTLHLYALAYAAVILSWPFPPARFLVPWTPFILYFLITGARTAVRLIPIELVRRRKASLRRIVTCAVIAITAWLFAREAALIWASTSESYYARGLRFDVGEFRAMEDWIRRNTSPDDVVASQRSARIYLATGRRGVNTWSDADPYWNYGPNREWATFYEVSSPLTRDALYRDMNRNLRREYRAAGVTHYVAYVQDPEVRVLGRLVREWPEWFLLEYTTPRGLFRVYRTGHEDERVVAEARLSSPSGHRQEEDVSRQIGAPRYTRPGSDDLELEPDDHGDGVRLEHRRQ